MVEGIDDGSAEDDEYDQQNKNGLAWFHLNPFFSRALKGATRGF